MLTSIIMTNIKVYLKLLSKLYKRQLKRNVNMTRVITTVYEYFSYDINILK